MDFEVRVAPGVLIPRPQTEHLVETALQSIQGVDNPLILDLGTGSGIIAIALARARPDARVVATDLSEDALAIAKGNIASLGLESRVRCLQGSWYEPLVGIGPFDLIVSNPPYIDVDDHHLEQGDLRFEPKSALTDGHDGLQAIREIVAGSTRFLKPGAALWVEHGWNQGSSARDIFTRAGFAKVQTFQDLAGLDRVTGGICTPDMLLSL